MAVPTNARILRAAPLKTGVMLGISPSSDPTFDVEIARATSSGVYSTQARLTAQGGRVPTVFTDILPVSTRSYSYKARAVKDGYNAGDYTAVVTAKPVVLPEVAPNVTPLTGQQIGATLFLSTGTPPAYGKAALAQTYDKSLTVYPFEFISTANAVTYSANAQRLYPQSTAARTFYWKSVIPLGSSVGRIDFYYRRPSTKGTVRFRVQTLSVSTVTATFIDYTATGAAAGIFTKTFTSGFSVGNVPIFIQLNMTSTSGTTSSVQLRQVGFTYRQPNVAVGV